MPSRLHGEAQARERALNKTVGVDRRHLPLCFREPEDVPCQGTLDHGGCIDRDDLEVLCADRFSDSAMATKFYAKSIALWEDRDHLPQEAIDFTGVWVCEAMNPYEVTNLWCENPIRSQYFFAAAEQVHHACTFIDIRRVELQEYLLGRFSFLWRSRLLHI